jgi:hypothetical protein
MAIPPSDLFIPQPMPAAGGFRKAATHGGCVVNILTDVARGMPDRLAAKQKFSVLSRADARGLLL